MRTNLVYYYILVDDDKPTKCKVGITSNPDQRIKAYKTGSPNSRFLKVYKNIERYHEKRILDLLKDIAKVQSEYVHFHPSLVKNIVEGYFIDNNIDYDE